MFKKQFLILWFVSISTMANSFILSLPSPERWVTHLTDELMNYWDMPDAWGTPVGNFPTFRCNDGLVYNAQNNPCKELHEGPSWIREQLGREYIRMKSRQTYSYGVAYHMTGDEHYLNLAKAGVDYIRANAIDRETGSVVSYFENGVPGRNALERTTQDLAYGLMGLAFYYYLTADQEVLEDIILVKNHIFQEYYNSDWDMLMWTRKDPQGMPGESGKMELVSQLDQINAYMAILTPILPEPYKSEWTNDLVKLAHIMIDKFYAPEHGIFWGTIESEDGKKFGARHNDFGHTIKTFWMIYKIGKIANDTSLIKFGKDNAIKIFEWAYIPDTGSWGESPRADGQIWKGKSWWVYAELDQVVATLSLEIPTLSRYITKTYKFWLDHMVDSNHGGVWQWVSNRDFEPSKLKTHHWKNGYHAVEHSLIAFITTSALKNQDVSLYFAGSSIDTSRFRPYFYNARDIGIDDSILIDNLGLQKIKVNFSKIH